MRIVFTILGLLSLGLGMIGVILPLLPTVPFILLAAFFFAHSSKKMHNYLIYHNFFGPMIRNWQRNGSIHPRAKIAATLSITAVFLISFAIGVPKYVLGIQSITLTAVMFFIWSRPNG